MLEVDLLTNNPEKIKGLEDYGIKVGQRVSRKIGSTDENYHYLKTKKERMGHIFDL